MEERQTTSTAVMDESKFIKLRRFNKIMAFLHLGQGTAMLVLSTDFSLPITTAFLKFDLAAQSLSPSLETLFTVPIVPLVAGFLFLSAIAHAMVSVFPHINKWYNRNLAIGINYARWIEYAFSSSLMIFVIAMLVGVYDVVSLLALFFLNAMMILFGWTMELHNQTTQRTNWTSYWFGVIAGAIPWVAVGIYLFGAGGGDQGPPSFVYWIYFSIFLFFNSFAINMVLQYKKVGKWQDYLYGEKTYIVLSLVAKSLLAWQVWAGTLRPV
jgi:hypothetical protein